jgi:LPXTG-motif cell wall-anchored protein
VKRLAPLAAAYALAAVLIAPAALRAADDPQPPDQGQQTAQPTDDQQAPSDPPAETQPAAPPQQPAQVQAAPQPASQPTPPPPAAPAPPAPAKKQDKPVAVAASPGSVTMKNIAFSPASISVNVGDSVTWTNADDVVHNVVLRDGSFQSGTIKKGASTSHTFSKAGTFAYQCTIHPGMDGTVRVAAASSGGGSGSSGSNGSNAGSSSDSAGSSSGSTASTGSSTAGLPSTGTDALGLAIVGAAMLGLGLALRRRETRAGG